MKERSAGTVLELGRFNVLPVSRLTSIGAYLSSSEGDILLPAKYLPEGLAAGARVAVFVYLDSEDRLVATTLHPKAQVGEFALLQVKETATVGAFLDWGLEKDLLVPFAEQALPMKKGEKHLVRLYLDRSGRIAASSRIDRFLERASAELKNGAEVELVFYEFTALGAKVVVGGRYPGLLFKNDLFGRYRVGDRTQGFVKKVREDGKIDVTLRKSGFQGVAGSRDTVIRVLEERGGFLPVGDKSTPEVIYELFRMSKKSFKTIIGNLYKQGVIEISKDGLKLK
ncbi:GntR family transcriptional regulator [Geomonas sp. Red276]